MPKTNAPAGHDWFTCRVTQDLKQFVKDNGGTKMVRRIITIRYMRKDSDPPIKIIEEAAGVYTKGCPSITFRVPRNLRDFIVSRGGASYVRSLLQDYKKYKEVEVSNG